MKKTQKYALIINRILIGLVLLVSGFIKLFEQGISEISSFLSSLGFFSSYFFAVILIFSEIVFGILVILNIKMKYVCVIPAFIMVLAGFLVFFGEWSLFGLHIAVASNFLLQGFLSESGRD